MNSGVSGSVLISTERGHLRADNLSKLIGLAVLGYDHVQSAPIWRHLIAVVILPEQERVRVRLMEGEFTCATGQLVYVERAGYLRADELVAGMPVLFDESLHIHHDADNAALLNGGHEPTPRGLSIGRMHVAGVSAARPATTYELVVGNFFASGVLVHAGHVEQGATDGEEG